jgi:hypothetical protein
MGPWEFILDAVQFFVDVAQDAREPVVTVRFYRSINRAAVVLYSHPHVSIPDAYVEAPTME